MEWIKCSERLPEIFQSVVLVNIGRFENTSQAFDDEMGSRNVHQCGYLSQHGGKKFWSVYGERALGVESYDYWMPLPEPPKEN
ncbi:MAG TPA: DUF551 domain-containing protein [bacterium]|nr:DUF551 domain-containing protein [bacterium]